jgi:hypothetical protein
MKISSKLKTGTNNAFIHLLKKDQMCEVFGNYHGPKRCFFCVQRIPFQMFCVQPVQVRLGSTTENVY